MIKRDSPVTMYYQVRQALERQIRDAGMQPGDRLPSVRAMVDTYGVSLPVIRQAIAELEKDGIVRVEHGRGSFVERVPSGGSAGLELPSSILFVSCSHELFDPYYARVLHGVQAASAQQDVQLVYAHPTTERPLGRLLESTLPLGVILCGELDDATLETVRGQGLPFVVAGDMRGVGLPENVWHIANDDFDGGYQVGLHLLANGHRQIGVIAGTQDLAFWRRRLAGFRQALSEHGADLPDHAIAYVANERPGEGASAAARLLSQSPQPTAIFASNDRFAYGVYAYLLNHGKRVGTSCSVVGFDDLDLSVELSPPLTTVHLDIEGVGKQAVAMLMQQIRCPGGTPETHVLPVTLMPRGSVLPAHAATLTSV